MNKKFKVINIMFLISLMFSGIFTGCGSLKSTADSRKAAFSNITPEEAKKRLDSEKGIILLDVRTKEEYDAGHIKNSILIPVDVLKDQAEEKLKDKEAVIFVYCRSGNRSTAASQILADLGYKKVYNLGGIINWPYEVVK